MPHSTSPAMTLLADGRPRYWVWQFSEKGKPHSYCVKDRLHDCWAMPITTDHQQANAICHLLSHPGDAPLVEVARGDGARQMELVP